MLNYTEAATKLAERENEAESLRKCLSDLVRALEEEEPNLVHCPESAQALYMAQRALSH